MHVVIFFRHSALDTESIYHGMDSRLRGNDGGRNENDQEGSRNDERRSTKKQLLFLSHSVLDTESIYHGMDSRLRSE